MEIKCLSMVYIHWITAPNHLARVSNPPPSWQTFIWTALFQIRVFPKVDDGRPRQSQVQQGTAWLSAEKIIVLYFCRRFENIEMYDTERDHLETTWKLPLLKNGEFFVVIEQKIASIEGAILTSWNEMIEICAGLGTLSGVHINGWGRGQVDNGGWIASFGLSTPKRRRLPQPREWWYRLLKIP